MHIDEHTRVTPGFALRAIADQWDQFLLPAIALFASVALIDNPLLLFCALIVIVNLTRAAAARALECDSTAANVNVIFRSLALLRYVMLHCLLVIVPIIATATIVSDPASAAEETIALTILLTAFPLYLFVGWRYWPGFASGVVLSWSNDYMQAFNRIGVTRRAFERIQSLRSLASLGARISAGLAHSLCFLLLLLLVLLAGLEQSVATWVVAALYAAILPVACTLVVGNTELVCRRWAQAHPDIAFLDAAKSKEVAADENLDFALQRLAAGRLLNPQPAPPRNANEALRQAVSGMFVDDVEAALAGGASPDDRDSQGVTALMTCALVSADPDRHDAALAVARLLLARGSDPDATLPPSGATALHLVAQGGSREMFELLADAGMSLSARDAANETPFLIVCRQGRSTLAAWITNHYGQSLLGDREAALEALGYAARSPHGDTFQRLFAAEVVKSKLVTPQDKNAVIKLATRTGSLAAVRQVADAFGLTALHILTGGVWDKGALGDSPWTNFDRAPKAVLGAVSEFVSYAPMQPLAYWSESTRLCFALGEVDEPTGKIININVITLPHGYEPSSRIEIGVDQHFTDARAFAKARKRRGFDPPSGLTRLLVAGVQDTAS